MRSMTGRNQHLGAAVCCEYSHRAARQKSHLPSRANTTPVTHTPSSASSAHLKSERIMKFTADIQPIDVTPDSATTAIARRSPLRTPVLATYSGQCGDFTDNALGRGAHERPFSRPRLFRCLGCRHGEGIRRQDDSAAPGRRDRNGSRPGPGSERSAQQPSHDRLRAALISEISCEVGTYIV